MNIQEYIDRAKELDNDVSIGEKVSDKTINMLEEAIGAPLPSSYKNFLRKYGSLDICSSSIAGVSNDDPFAMQYGWIYAHTMIMREDYKKDYDVPDYLWVLEGHEDGAYCFNINIKTVDDEYAIVNYEPYLPEKTFSEIMYSTFHDFLKECYFPAYVNPNPYS